MRIKISHGFQQITQRRFALSVAFNNLIRHEWNALDGHRLALAARISVARQAKDPSQFFRDQIDLLPESRNRLRRNRETRRRILSELTDALLGIFRPAD